MKKVVLNISDSIYEKLKYESILEKKDIQELIKERLFHKPFDIEVEEAFQGWLVTEVQKIIEE